MVTSEEIKYDEIIGKGSFGEVWNGYFRGKQVAIKKLNYLNKQNIRDFIRELNIMCSLRHPNCVLFMGACLEETNMCIIMEYCSKGNLFDILHDVSQPIDYTRILQVLMEVAEGILYLHLNTPPILHRDLKSLNILVDENWNLKVSDFGLTDFKPDVEGTTNLQLGTPFWLAPEAMENQIFTEASDVYSFGMIIWEMFTRDIPFNNLNPHQAALAVISEDKRPIIPNFVPPKFAQLINDCWTREPAARPTVPQILEKLHELKKEGLPRIELSLVNAKLYRKGTTVFAFRSKDTVIVYKPW
jgi:serine/threonine-protein kinase CTR1